MTRIIIYVPLTADFVINPPINISYISAYLRTLTVL